jgi:short-subunit dehydrogenase
MSKETTLITGVSSGIGLHLAKEFAKHGHSLVLVAPVEAELQAIASDTKGAHNVEVRAIATDLRQAEADTAIRDGVGDTTVEMLVNNAGHGKKGKAWEIPSEEADMMGTPAFQQARLMAPQEAAHNALMAADRVVVPGIANKAMVFARRFLPESVQAKRNAMLTDDAPPEKQKRDRGDMETKAAER